MTHNTRLVNANIIFLAPKEPVFTAGQLERLSNIADNAGAVFFAVGVVTPLFTVIDKPDWIGILMGITASTSFWALSIFLTKKGEYS